jgi:hypothetical protein
MKLTRREMVPVLAAFAGATLPAATVAEGLQPSGEPPQSTAAPQAAATFNPGSLEKAQDDVRAASDRLRKVDIPMDLEPAFAFRP